MSKAGHYCSGDFTSDEERRKRTARPEKKARTGNKAADVRPEEHLTVTQFKVEQERKRHDALRAENAEIEMTLLGLEEKKVDAENELHDISRQAEEAQDRLKELTPRINDAEAFIEKHLGKPEALLPEASFAERATHYREEKALPVLQRLWKLVLSLYHKLQELRRDFRSLQSKFESVSRDRDIYKRRWEKAGEENETLKAELQDYDRVKQELGPTQITGLIARSKAREAAEKAARQETSIYPYMRTTVHKPREGRIIG